MLAIPVNGASLAVLRICLGVVMMLEAYSLATPSAMMQGRTPMESFYVGQENKFHLPYDGFEWLPMLPPDGMWAVLALQAVAGAFMAAGFFYRPAVVAAFLSFAYFFGVESTRTYWQSYYYVEFLFMFLILWMPAARRFSVDAWLARRRGQPLPETVPFWNLFVLRGQLVIAYFYAGFCKLNADWMLDFMPVRWDLGEARLIQSPPSFLSQAQVEAVKNFLQSVEFAGFIAWVGTFFDLAVGFLLVFRRTRLLGFALMVIFHSTNHFVIYENIDWFPLVGVTTALIFLSAEWPQRFWTWLREPYFTRPDKGWMTAGAVMVPVVGALMGWKAAASKRGVATGSPGPWAARFVAMWLVWQFLMPLRQFAIPGDARFTYEGLSWSWRLKADDHQAQSALLFLDDPVVVSRDAAGRMKVDFSQWRGEKVIYRNVTSTPIQWAQLPEVLVVLEPILGERVIYNPLAGPPGIRNEADARQRVRDLWMQTYGRAPAAIHAAESLTQVLGGVSKGLALGGLRQEAAQVDSLTARAAQLDLSAADTPTSLATRRAIRMMFQDFRARDPRGEMLPYFQKIVPFALERQAPAAGRFLVIEDPQLFEPGGNTNGQRILVSAWKGGPHTGGSRTANDVYVGAQPLVVHMGDIAEEAKTRLPLTCLLDSQDQPAQPPQIYWNGLRDLPASKLMHISNQAFYLRRYARRVADLWQSENGRRPAVRAQTAVSLNGRPYQSLVDPKVDLASVPVKWFGHNEWVNDLEMKRIPREVLENVKLRRRR